MVHEAKRADPIVLVQDYHFALLPACSATNCRTRPSSRSGISHGRILRSSESARGRRRSSSDCSAAQSRLPHAISLQQFPRYGRPFHGGADRPRAFVHRLRRSGKLRPALSDLHRVAAGGHEGSEAGARVSRRRCGSGSVSREDVRLGIGVERFDYTKGILDRLRAVDAFLSSRPQWRSRFIFLQIAAPTRANSQPTVRCKPKPPNWPATSMPAMAAKPTSRFP